MVLTYFTKIVSISSIAVILLTPVWMFVFKQPLSYILYCLLGALYIVYLHRENIKRLISGQSRHVLETRQKQNSSNAQIQNANIHGESIVKDKVF